MENKLKTMTVGELKEFLGRYPEDLPVVFAYPSGDHWRTELAGTVRDGDYGLAQYTAYHRGFKVAEDEDENPGSRQEAKVEVLILK